MKPSLTLLCHITGIKGKINSNCQIKANFEPEKLQFLRTKIYSINLHSSVIPFWTYGWLKHSMHMQLSLNFISSAMVDHIIFTFQDLFKV